MKTKSLRQLRRDFLNETKNHFNLTNRAVLPGRGCRYHIPETGIGCAIGRKIEDKTLCVTLDSCSMNIGVSSGAVFSKLPSDLQKLGQRFLGQVQILHDDEDHWTETGLSEKGKQTVARIRQEFKL